MKNDDDCKTLFHGSNAAFSTFDPAFYYKGEGRGTFKGWHFTENIRGAYFHCTNYLKGAYKRVYECKIDKRLIISDCEYGHTENVYGGQADGVLLEHSDQIRIIRLWTLTEIEELLWPWEE